LPEGLVRINVQQRCMFPLQQNGRRGVARRTGEGSMRQLLMRARIRDSR
jgi:hypothetical protein